MIWGIPSDDDEDLEEEVRTETGFGCVVGEWAYPSPFAPGALYVSQCPQHLLSVMVKISEEEKNVLCNHLLSHLSCQCVVRNTTAERGLVHHDHSILLQCWTTCQRWKLQNTTSLRAS